MLMCSPTDIVARTIKYGNGINGIKDAKKLARASAKYPTSDANGNKISEKEVKSTNQSFHYTVFN